MHEHRSVRHGAPHDAPGEFPVLETPGVLTRAIALLSIIGAVVLIVAQALRLLSALGGMVWWVLPVLLLGMCVADLLSGIVHWAADSWGRATMPVLGKRLLHPFRVHHVNPADFLRRHWIDTNGDVATIVSAVLASAYAIPLQHAAGQSALLFVVAVASITLPTNQVHQWAHMRHPPRVIGWLQSGGVLLSHQQHARHHDPPYVTNYCIALGWCNGMLVKFRFFPRLERLITSLTGARPRADEDH